MLVIRLQRKGKKKQAFFRVVLQEKSWKAQGKALELLGFYNPRTKEKRFQKERINFWISKGAQPSPTAHNLFVDAKIIEGKKVKAWQPKKRKSADLSDKASATAGVSAKDGKKEDLPAEAGEAVKTEAEKTSTAEVKPETKTKKEEAAPEAVKEEVKSEEKKEDSPKDEVKPEPTNAEEKEPVKEEAPVKEKEPA